MVDKVQWIWQNGKMIRWDDAQVHIMTHSLHYGLAAFEGVRCYAQSGGGAALFRLHEHLDRLYKSAQICMFEIPHKKEDVVAACRELVRKNDLLDGCYLRPLVYMGEGPMGIAATGNPIDFAIMAWRWGAYLGEEGIKNGIRAKVSSFRRARGDMLVPKAKITGQYVGSILAKREAQKSGYQEALMLDAQGFVCEGTGENVFIVENGTVRTPATSSPILNGITRDSVLRILHDEGVPVREESIARDEMYSADEVFLTGTAAEITPVREVDNRAIGTGKPGPITQMMQERYHKTVRGEIERYRRWLTPV